MILRCKLTVKPIALGLVISYTCTFRAFDLSRASVDLISFATGIGLTVVLETFIDERGVGSPMVPQDPGLKGVCTAYMLGDPASYDAVWRIVVATPALFMALNDLITGIILPHQGARIAGQILETIRDPGIT